MRLGEYEVAEQVSVSLSGSIAIDLVLGVDGFPRGRIVEGLEIRTFVAAWTWTSEL
jgi:RecA/RadA recombinase